MAQALINLVSISGRDIVDTSEVSPNELKDGLIYWYDLSETTTEVTIPSVRGIDNRCATCEVWIKTGASVPTIHWPSDTVWVDEADTTKAPDLETSKTHCFTLRNTSRTTTNKILASLQHSY